MKKLITYRGIIYPWQCDHMGHMNVMWYTGKFDEASWVLLAHLGLTPSRLKEAHRGMAAVQQNITYQKELRAGDVVTIRTKIIEIREKVLRFVHEMVKEPTGETAAITELTGVHMDTRRRKSIELPSDILTNAREVMLHQNEGVEDEEAFHETLPGIGTRDNWGTQVSASIG